MRKIETATTNANNSSIVDSKENGALANTTVAAKEFEIHFTEWIKNKPCSINGLNCNNLIGKKITAELVFSFDGSPVFNSKYPEHFIMGYNEIIYSSVSELLKFLHDFNSEIISFFSLKHKLNCDICSINFDGDKWYKWNYTYAHHCFGEGSINECNLLEIIFSEEFDYPEL